MNQKENEKEIEKSVEQSIDKLNLITYQNVSKCKSIRRAIRRGTISKYGIKYPKRPFNNRKNKPLEDEKRVIYKNFKNKNKNIISKEIIELDD